jgi:urease subunit beta
MRFEPGQARTVRLVPFRGTGTVVGFDQQVMGALD